MPLTETHVLISTAAFVAFFHTLIGPDHYLVFVALGKARNWSLSKTLKYTSLCGIGHIMSSIIIGMIGIFLGIELIKLVNLEESRGIISGWALLFFGFVYFVWGLRKSNQQNLHKKFDKYKEEDIHKNDKDRLLLKQTKERFNFTPWAVFIIFVLGPCEALIPLFMYPAIETNMKLVILIALVFGIVTLVTMLIAVFVVMKGLQFVQFNSIEKYSHAIAGASIMMCAFVINFVGL
ncbi:MAG TPA: sulfite exporter TauE/SafE family protein [Woeseiaceae bacterium]|nr:sulfite exporter TauE/SafE family protein [Woeseiaceae bacterium]